MSVAQQVADAVGRNGPRVVLCFSCLATKEGLKEHDVRGVALVLMVRWGLRMARRVCYSCGRKEETLVNRKVA